MPQYIDIHALQTLPPSNINRDESGAPKSAIFGGVLRQRVSSQAWKKAVRKDFKDRLDPAKLGQRTKRLVDLVLRHLNEIDEPWLSQQDQAEVENQVSEIFKKAGIKLVDPPKAKKDDQANEQPAPTAQRTDYLYFISNQQVDKVARWIRENFGSKIDKKTAARMLDTDHSVDIAMFGRMIADDASYNVDAAVQVAHAIGVHGSEPEFDYFTAVDDVEEAEEKSGAGMIGTAQMMSSTLYRYATINVDQLRKNLGTAEATREAATTFLHSFVHSLPSGKSNTFANHTLPEAVVVSIRDDRPISYVNAFELPVEDTETGGRRRAAVARLVKEAQEIEQAYSAPAVRTLTFGVGQLAEDLKALGNSASLDEILSEVRTQIPDGDA